jgi:hypothetical protein
MRSNAMVFPMNDGNGSSTGLSEAAITRALQSLQDRISRAERDRKAAEEEISICREEERLLSSLLAIRRGDRNQTAPERIGSGIEHADAKPAMAAVVRELAAAGRPVHISELMRLLAAANVPIPGAGAQANLIAHMSRDQRIVRPSRGLYGLAAWGLENMPAPSRRRRRKRVRVTENRSSNEHRTQ